MAKRGETDKNKLAIGPLLWEKFGFESTDCKSMLGRRAYIRVGSWKRWNPSICVDRAVALVIDPNIQHWNELDCVIAMVGSEKGEKFPPTCIRRGDSLEIAFDHKEYPSGYVAVYLRIHGRFPWPSVYRMVFFPFEDERPESHTVIIKVV